MKSSVDTKRIKLYLWVGLVYTLIWISSDFFEYRDTFLQRSVNVIWRSIYLVAVNFLFFEYGIPFIRFTWKTVFFPVVTIVIQLLLVSLGLFVWRFVGIQLHIWTSYKNFSLEEGVYSQMEAGFFSMMFFGIIVHIFDYMKLRQMAQQLRIEKQEAELNYLKSQTNPHFLFNTLNNIYSLAKDKSDLAPESILRLSKILRFMLYETGSGFIAIEQEIQIMSDYISLEKLRYDDTLQVNFNYEVEDMKQSIPPLLLMPLVENAFKHGVAETTGDPFVDIQLTINKRQLSFVVKNSSEALNEEPAIKENIGLSNLRRQLQLLYADYQLTVQQVENVFTAILKINLATHV